MESNSDLYDDVFATYIQVIKQDSPEAAALVEQIHSVCGSRAALRATLVVSLSKMEFEKNHSVRDIGTDLYLLKDFPEAIPLLERALTRCLLAWNTSRMEALGLANKNPSGADGEASAPAPHFPIA